MVVRAGRWAPIAPSYNAFTVAKFPRSVRKMVALGDVGPRPTAVVQHSPDVGQDLLGLGLDPAGDELPVAVDAHLPGEQHEVPGPDRRRVRARDRRRARRGNRLDCHPSMTGSCQVSAGSSMSRFCSSGPHVWRWYG